MDTGFLLTSLIVVLIPGTGVIYTVSTGLMNTRKNTIFAAIGCTLGILPHLTASILGISALLNTGAIIFQTIKYTGVLYLLYLAWNIWKDKETITFNKIESGKSMIKIISRGILINLLNPKLTMFFLAFLPQFINNNSSVPYLVQMLNLSSVFMGLTFTIFAIYGMLANHFKKIVANSPSIMRNIQKAFAVTFAGLAAKLALSE